MAAALEQQGISVRNTMSIFTSINEVATNLINDLEVIEHAMIKVDNSRMHMFTLLTRK
jgi:hypothetical protein